MRTLIKVHTHNTEYLEEMRHCAWYNTIKYLVIDADTRTMEFFIAVFTVLFGIWVAVTDQVTKGFFVILNLPETRFIFSFFAIFIGLSLLFTLSYKYPKFRVYGAAFSTFFWVVTSWNCIKADSLTFMGWCACMFSLASMWVLTHRAAVTK